MTPATRRALLILSSLFALPHASRVNAEPTPATTRAATTTTSPTTTTTTAPSTAPSRSAARISIAKIAAAAEQTSATLKRIDADLSSDRVVANVDTPLDALTNEINSRMEETQRIVAAAPSLRDLQSLENEWGEVRRQLATWLGDLSSRARALSRERNELADAAAAWQRNLENLHAAGDAAAGEMLDRAEQVSRQVTDARARVDARLSQVHALQARVAAQDVRVAEAIDDVRVAQSKAASRLLERDSAPLWTGRLGADADSRRNQGEQNLAEASRDSFRRQLTEVWAYAKRYPHRFVVHAFLVAILAAGASQVRRRWGQRLEADAATARNAAAFRMPIATGLLGTLPLIPWIYVDAPRLLMALVGASLLAPAILVMSRLVIRPLLPLLYALAAFYAVGLVVSVTGSMPALSRLLFLLNMVAGVVLISRFLYRAPRSESFPHFAQTRHYKLIRIVLQIALVILSTSVAANVLGFVSLSRLLGEGVLAAAYVGIILDAYVRIAHALIAVALMVRPMSETRMVKRHGPLLRRRLTILVAIAAGAWWLVITLNAFSVRRQVFEFVYDALTARWGVGAVNLSLGGILSFAAAVWASFLVSRFVRFVLQEDVYPRVHLSRGIPYAISTLLHYVILFVGFLIAVGALGYDMTKFTVLAGAFGVGLGFGMQNIVNNFVSGLILLFERPIQLGDVVELDPSTVGVVTRIGIRASVVRTGDAADVIVPNGNLIANRITNWTLSNRQRGFSVSLAVGPGNDPQAVIDLVHRVALETDCVAKTPEPQVFVTEFLPGGALKFEMRVWTDRFDDWFAARSKVVSAVHNALAHAAIQRV